MTIMPRNMAFEKYQEKIIYYHRYRVIDRMYHIVRYIANKPPTGGGKDLAVGSIQYTRDDINQAEQILTKLYEISSNQKNMRIQKRTKYSFRCENGAHKYLFKISKGNTKNEKKILEDIYL